MQQAMPETSGGADSSSRTLWAGDLAYYVDEAFLHQVFATFVGTNALVSVKVIRNKTTQMSEGYGFVEFASHEAADHVLRTLNGQLIPNTDQIFRLNWAAFGVGKTADGDNTDHSVFVGDLAADVTDYVLQEHFRRYFPSVRSAKVITDPMTGRSKGYGFVRFGNEQERDRALGDMMGHFISNRPIRVSIATAKKNPSGALSANAVAAGIPHPSDFDPTNTTLFIGGLSAGVSEEDLHSIFGRYGDIIYTKIPPGKGCGFVQFVQRASAETAMAQMQGQVIGSSAIRLSWGRSSTASRPPPVTPAASAYGSAYPSTYSAGGAFGGYNPAAAYGAFAAPQQPAAQAGLDPFAAYAYLGQAGVDPALYQAYQQQALAAASQGAGSLFGGAGSLQQQLAAAQQQKPEAVDPLASLDIEKLNAAYMQRNQAALLGSHLNNNNNSTPTTG